MKDLRRKIKVWLLCLTLRQRMKKQKQILLVNSQIHWPCWEESLTKLSRDLTGSQSQMSRTSCLTTTERLIMQEDWAFKEREKMKRDLADLGESSIMSVKAMVTSSLNVLHF